MKKKWICLLLAVCCLGLCACKQAPAASPPATPEQTEIPTPSPDVTPSPSPSAVRDARIALTDEIGFQLGQPLSAYSGTFEAGQLRWLRSISTSYLFGWDVWQNAKSQAEYEQNAWDRYSFSSDLATCIFDGKEQTLLSVTVRSDSVTSEKGLAVGQSLDKMRSLYGDAPKEYALEDDEVLYEYDLGNAYFFVRAYANRSTVESWGISAISEAENQQALQKLEALQASFQ